MPDVPPQLPPTDPLQPETAANGARAESLWGGRPIPVWAWWSILVLGLAKLALVAHDEILSISADDTGFARYAAAWYWGHAYGMYSHNRQPGFPLFVAITGMFGVPYRISIELAWMAAAALTARAMRACGARAPACVLAFAAMAFDPLALIDRLLADPLHGAAYLALVAGLGGAVAAGGARALRRWSAVAAVAAAVAANTRPESVLVYLVIAFAGAMVVVQRLIRADAHGRMFPRLAAVVLIPVLAAQGLTHAFALANKRAIGVYTTYDLAMPGFRGLYRALLALTPATPRLPVPIPRDVRETAYGTSPTFASLRPYLEGDGAPFPGLRAECESYSGVKGEYGAWTIWALREAAWRAKAADGKPYDSAAEFDGFFARAAKELNAGAREHSLSTRWAPSDFVPPEWGLIAHAAPEVAWRQLLRLSNRTYGREAQNDVGPKLERTFDAAANRRSAQRAISLGEEVHGARTFSRAAVEFRETLKAAIVRVQNGLLMVGAVPVLMALMVIVGWGRTIARGPNAAGAALLVLGAGAFCARWALVTLLDLCGVMVTSEMDAGGKLVARAFGDCPLAQLRYLLPMSPLAGMLAVMSVDLLARFAGAGRSPNRPPVNP